MNTFNIFHFSYLNTFETDILVFILVFMEMKSIRIRILLKVFAPGLTFTAVKNLKIISLP